MAECWIGRRITLLIGCNHIVIWLVCRGSGAGSGASKDEKKTPKRKYEPFRIDDEDELLTWINDTDYGLSGYVFSRDLGWALRLAERMEVGMVGVNRGLVSDPAAPFGGVKQSGIGREGAREGIREFQETQYYSVAWG